jgi:hypothetical protein
MGSRREGPVVLVKLGAVEQRYQAVLEVPGGTSLTEGRSAKRVARQAFHDWLRL